MRCYLIFISSVVITSIFYNCKDDNKDQSLDAGSIVLAKMDIMLEGERLFDQHCAVCHSKELDKDLTGPKLGYISKYRKMDWLINFTKYPYEMIQYGDSISLCIWEKWQPTLKGSFLNSYYGFSNNSLVTETKDVDESVVNNQITKIYDWISYESEKQDLDYRIIPSEEICNNIIDFEYGSNSEIFSMIRGSGIEGIQKLSSGRMVKRLEVVISSKVRTRNDFRFSLLLPEKNLAIPFVKCEGKYILLGSQGMKSMSLPSKEKIFLYGERLVMDDDNYLLKELGNPKGEIIIEESDFSLSFDEIAEYKFEE